METRRKSYLPVWELNDAEKAILLDKTPLIVKEFNNLRLVLIESEFGDFALSFEECKSTDLMNKDRWDLIEVPESFGYMAKSMLKEKMGNYI